MSLRGGDDPHEPSEFGAGVVVCLAKFSEHLHEHGPFSERMVWEFSRWTPEEKARCERDARGFPRGDSAAKLARMSVAEIGGLPGDSHEQRLSELIRLWLNAASDHFYDLDKEHAPQPLRDLAALTISIGHGFGQQTWTVEHVKRIRELWRESCLAIDRQLGASPEWGDH